MTSPSANLLASRASDFQILLASRASDFQIYFPEGLANNSDCRNIHDCTITKRVDCPFIMVY